jgi:hypothetical protein
MRARVATLYLINVMDGTMDQCDDCGSGRSAVALGAVMALVFAVYFGVRVTVPELPLYVQQALVLLP